MKKAARAARDIALNMFEGWDAGAVPTNTCIEADTRRNLKRHARKG